MWKYFLNSIFCGSRRGVFCMSFLCWWKGLRSYWLNLGCWFLRWWMYNLKCMRIGLRWIKWSWIYMRCMWILVLDILLVLKLSLMLNWGGVISLIFYWSILFDLFICEKENFLNCEILCFCVMVLCLENVFFVLCILFKLKFGKNMIFIDFFCIEVYG